MSVTPDYDDPGWRDVEHDTKTLACMDRHRPACPLPSHCRCACHDEADQ